MRMIYLENCDMSLKILNLRDCFFSLGDTHWNLLSLVIQKTFWEGRLNLIREDKGHCQKNASLTLMNFVLQGA